MKKIFTLALALSWGLLVFAQPKPIKLYPKGIPNSKPAPAGYTEKTVNQTTTMVTEPTLTPYLPEKGKANGTAVIICPGGGYTHLAMGHEGADVAKRFNAIGVTAFVLKYRLPSDAIMINKAIGPLQDAQRAIQIVRENAKQWGIDTAKVGVIGFSAGGHLASTLGTHFNKAVIDNPQHTNLRPDFMLLLYPRIAFVDPEHSASIGTLIGKDAPQPLRDLFSNDKQVTPETPPTFIVQAEDDPTVPVQQSLQLYYALLKNHIKAELHIYQAGGHGFGLNNKTTKDEWFERCVNFLTQNGFYK